ncbi:MAG TPA: hypothetical protein VGO56_11585 [Pyrinomonadaceae bacterium]|nr:hypothetical protein [Pyrinomonadaceae bacterium]
MTDWTPQDTTTHQDHVIAHVLGATFLGYFVFEEALYVLLNIGFIWTIFLDGEMGLLPHPVAVSELEIDAAAKDEIKEDIDVLLSDGATKDLMRLLTPSVQCQIIDVAFFASGERRRLLISGEEGDIAVEMSLTTAAILVEENQSLER